MLQKVTQGNHLIVKGSHTSFMVIFGLSLLISTRRYIMQKGLLPFSAWHMSLSKTMVVDFC